VPHGWHCLCRCCDEEGISCQDTLKELGKTVSVVGNMVAIDGNLLFSRLLIVLQRKQEIEPYFECELTPVPTSLFKNESLCHSSLLWVFIQQYVDFVCNHYGHHCVIVFDGYGNVPSVKDHEHQRRAMKSCLHVDVAEQKSLFLTTSRNQKLFVQILLE